MDRVTQPTRPPTARRLGELVALLEARGMLRTLIEGGDRRPAQIGVDGVAYDSRRVAAGGLFVAIPGARHDGHEYALAACGQGAVAVIAEHAIADLPVPQLLVHAARPALALAAAWWAGFPSRDLGVVGVTGTDGKTTTSFLVRAMIEATGSGCGLVGTVESVVGGRAAYGGRATTPEAPELQATLAAMRAAGDRFAVVESTSHGLAQHRVGELAYDVAVLTNISHEHLEFHGTHEAYRAAKRRLFEALAVGEANPEKGWGKWGVINADDPWAAEFTAAVGGAGARLVSYGADPRAAVRLTSLEQDATGLQLGVTTSRWSGSLAVRLAGRFNAWNALAAVAVGEALGLDAAAVRRGIESVQAVPGRMERVPCDSPFEVIVDYAHTPRALELVLDELAPVAAARGGGLVAVFGSAGERDVVKRPLMGQVAGERCRLVVLTDEDPRGEDRMAVLEAIAAGAEAAGRRQGHDLLLIPDREEAIATAVDQAQPGDIVLLAGKGHEPTIEMADGPRAWNEREVALRVLGARGYAGG